jgi:predicted MFS family arabinose efflux permease
MATAYVRVLRLPGAWQFTSAALIARLPLAMDALATVILISTLTGSYAQAGAVVATFGITGAIGSILLARAADRFGQARVLVPSCLVHAAALVSIVALVEWRTPLVAQMLVAAVAGLTGPPIGSFARARWVRVAPDDAAVRSGFAIESILDEVVFTLGPLLTAWLAFTFALPLPLFIAASLVVIGSMLLAIQRRTQPHVDRSVLRPTLLSALRVPAMPFVVLAALGLGCLFGCFEVTTVAFTRIAGNSGAAGVVLGLFALGSMFGGLAYGSRHWHQRLPLQAVVLAGLLCLASAVIPWVNTVGALAITTVLAGLLVAPVLITTFALTERLVPPAQLTEGLSWTLSGLALGFAMGSWLGGLAVDNAGTTSGYLLAWGATLWFLLWMLLGMRPLLRAVAAPRGAERAAVANPAVADHVPGPAPTPFDEAT